MPRTASFTEATSLSRNVTTKSEPTSVKRGFWGNLMKSNESPSPVAVALADTEPSFVPEPVSEVTLELRLPPALPDDVIGDMGSVCFERLFEGAQIPLVKVTAEHATHILASFPADLPLSTKRVLVKTSLHVMGDLVKETTVSADIVSDAVQKMLWIARLQEKVVSDRDTQRESVHADIALLEAQIEAKNRLLAEAEACANVALAQCRERTNALHDVTVFFDQDKSGGNGIGQPAQDSSQHEELPSHLRDDSVRRLLGLSDLVESQDTQERDWNAVPVESNGVHRYA